MNSALPYASGPLHLGHIAGSYLGADIFVRFNRLLGNEVLFICGSDEYGTPITIKADKEKVDPSVIAERYHKEHEATFKGLDIEFDIFSRTTYPEHARIAGEIFLDLYNKGFLKEDTMDSAYCNTCARYLPDRYVEGTCPNCGFEKARGDQCDICGKILDPKDLVRPVCAISGDTPEFRRTKHLFLLLDKLQPELLKWFDGKDNWRQNVRAFTRNFIGNGLKPRPVTRDLEWGVPVPVIGYEKKRIYVWFEALIGYVSASIIFSKEKGDPDYWKKFWQDKSVPAYYFLGKDNITFHSVIWPSILIAHSSLNLPYDIPANEYLVLSGKKFSRSRSVGFVVDEALKNYDKDYIRYYLSTILPESGDAEFSFDELVEKTNSELISKYGNLVHRLSSFASARSLSVKRPATLDELSTGAMEKCRKTVDDWKNLLEAVEIKKALRKILDLIQYTNAFFNESRPWDLIKTDSEKANEKIWVIGFLTAWATVTIFPYVPSSARKIWKTLGFPGGVENGLTTLQGKDFAFTPVKSDPPFKPIEVSEAPAGPHLVVGEIGEVKDHPNAEKLLLLGVDIGTRKIRLVAGLRMHYDPSDLVGRKIVVVENLKHSRIRGEESQGMLLAADDGDHVRYLTVKDSIPVGAEVKIGNDAYGDSGEISIEELQGFGIRISERNGSQIAISSRDGREETLTVNGSGVFPEKPVKVDSPVR